MTTDLQPAIAANPRDPSLWLLLAEQLDQRPEAWEREKCKHCGGGGSCSYCDGGICLYHPPAMTAHRARLTWWGLMMEREEWHGVEPAPRTVNQDAGYGEMVLGDFFPDAVVPTFALLWDREENCPKCSFQGVSFQPSCWICHGKGKRIIPGHASELASYMESQGDGRAKAVREIRVEDEGSGTWSVRDGNIFAAQGLAYPDACREAIKRIVGVFTETCRCTEDSGVIDPKEDCQDCCFGLGWRATEGVKVPV